MIPERRPPDPSSPLGARGECLLYIVLLAGIVWFPFAAALNAGADDYPAAGTILATANLVMAILGIAFLLVIGARAAPHTWTAVVAFGDYLALLALCAYDSLAHLVAHHLLPTLLDISTRIFGPNLTSLATNIWPAVIVMPGILQALSSFLRQRRLEGSVSDPAQ